MGGYAGRTNPVGGAVRSSWDRRILASERAASATYEAIFTIFVVQKGIGVMVAGVNQFRREAGDDLVNEIHHTGTSLKMA